MKDMLVTSLAVKAARLLIGIMLLASFVSLSPTRAAYAASIDVTTYVDDFINNGNCTLREAIYAANTDQPRDRCAAGSGTDTIVLGPRPVYLIGPANDDLGYSGDLDITASLNLVGDKANPTVISGSNIDRVFDIQPGVQATVSNVTIQDGMGGGIRNQGLFRLNDSTVSNNNGYGIANMGTLYVSKSTITNNSDSGIFHQGVMVTVESSTISHNWGVVGGGGILLAGGSFLMSNSTVSGNKTGGYWWNAGIQVYDAGKLTVSFSTITDNEFGGVATYGNGQVTIQHTILAGNISRDCYGTLTSYGNNLIQKSEWTLAAKSTDLLNKDPMLGPLQNNGGPTLTHAPLPGSPVIDAGQASLSSTGSTTDQRGAARYSDGNRDGRTQYDMGAVEVAP